MSAVEVEIAKEPRDDAGANPSGDASSSGNSGRRTRKEAPRSESPEVEREVTKRELIRSVSNILIVILYMVFTLLRDRESGVVVVDDEGADDWEG